MLLADHEIRDLCVRDSWEKIEWKSNYLFSHMATYGGFFNQMVDPFSEATSGGGIISYGLTHAGYDLRLAPEIHMFKNTFGEVVDPKFFSNADYCQRVLDKQTIDKSFILPAGAYFLGHSFEYLRIPRYLKGRCTGKSTLARSGVLVNTTPLEPGWEGHLTIEVGNVSGCPVRIHVMEGIAQLEFELLSSVCETSYADKKGIYQGQQGVTPARTRE